MTFAALSACGDPTAKAQVSSAPTDVTPEFFQNWRVDYGKSNIQFEAEQGGDVFTGTFETFTAQIMFDPNDLGNAKVIAVIHLTSAETDDIERADAMPGKDWFYVKKFPTARFETTRITQASSGKYTAEGTLTLRGITKSITLPFDLSIDGEYARMSGALTLDRTDFNVGTGAWADADWAGHEVKIKVIIEALSIGGK